MHVLNLYLKKFTLIILALQILNLSIYNSDFYNFHTITIEQQQDLNPVDSFAELIIESVDGYQNAFPESENQTEKQASGLKQTVSFTLIQLDFFTRLPEKNCFTYEAKEKPCSPFRENYSYLFFEEINHPPS